MARQTREERLAKKREDNKRRREDPKYREKIRNQQRIRREDPKVREKEHEYDKRRREAPGAKEKRQEYNKYYREIKHPMTPADKEKKREYDKRRRKKPGFREKERVRHRLYRQEHPELSFNAQSKRRALIGDAKITTEEWRQVMLSTNFTCSYCGCRLTRNNRSVDHIVPLNKGGEHTVDNLAPACRSCNSSKQDKLLSEWQNDLPKQDE